MSDFKIKTTWIPTEENDILKKTLAYLLIRVKDCTLTRNVNTWDKKIGDSIIVSAYPLAEWFAYYWWKLENELMPNSVKEINFDWKAAHEISAANNGFVWPQITLASDGEFVNVYSQIFSMPGQSVEYIYNFDSPQTISLPEFQKEITRFIESTINKLGTIDSNLKDLWDTVTEESQDEKIKLTRQMEAAMGFDPEECPEELLRSAFDFQSQVGKNSIKEVAPLLKSNSDWQKRIRELKGFEISVDLPKGEFDLNNSVLPWKKGINTARSLRKTLDLGEGAVKDNKICEILGITKNEFRKLSSNASLPISIGVNLSENKWSILPRYKKIKTSQRFELSRLLGDAIMYPYSNREWMVASDYNSYRQKAQKAFAAEFLCPINSLCDFLKEDYSEEKQEEASLYFGVSLQTVNSSLVNHHVIGRDRLLLFNR